jgi:phosphoribosylamine--glycine ligase / phosphoribosylformylglycinamidine cyclo-ligase
MRILLLGAGGREHALAWKLSQSTLVKQIYICPGNGGSCREPKSVNVDLSIADFPKLVDFAIKNKVRDYPSIGPDNSLSPAFEDRSRHPRSRAASRRWRRRTFSKRCVHPSIDAFTTPFTFNLVGIPVFGPSLNAARMEGSKTFAKAFMHRHSIPTAKFRVFSSSQLDQAIEFVKTCGFKVVLKANGLAAGKGVLIPGTVEEAIIGLRDIMIDNVFGLAGLRKHYSNLGTCSFRLKAIKL